MTRPKGQEGRRKGRPQSLVGQVGTPLSRQVYKCRVCNIEKRSDKLRIIVEKKFGLMKLANQLRKIQKNFLNWIKTARTTLDTLLKMAIHGIKFHP